ncbi:rCG53981 [Rattus norvegicus]|uniref:RCG53981 n=1 Tax=Rattus norvegicus TaxID=10116 RepID=A6J9C9_RAT|nr:rCG53981 [Rattus norvegicus]
MADRCQPRTHPYTTDQAEVALEFVHRGPSPGGARQRFGV